MSLDITGAQLLEHSEVVEQLSGAELQVSLEQMTAQPLPREVQGRIELAKLALEVGREHPLFICARQRDQSRVWTSALFVTR